MKKITLIVVIIIASYSFSNAQEFGVRLGDVSGGSVAVDAVFSTGQFNRVHSDISFGDGVGIDVLWDFLYRPMPGEVLSWYMGVGPYTNLSNDFQLGAVAEIGLEYKFSSVPISLSADYRPTFELIDHTSIHFGGFGLNVRWIFGD